VKAAQRVPRPVPIRCQVTVVVPSSGSLLSTFTANLYINPEVDSKLELQQIHTTTTRDGSHTRYGHRCRRSHSQQDWSPAAGTAPVGSFTVIMMRDENWQQSSIMEIGEAIKNPAYRIFQTEYSGCLDISAHA